MLNSWIREAGGWWLTGLRSDLNPCGGTSLHLLVKLRVTQRSVNCCFPRKRKSDEEMVSASFPYLFCCEVGFSKVRHLRRPSHSAAWVTLRILWSRGLAADGRSAWFMTSPSTPLRVPSISLGLLRSHVAGFSLQWQLTQSNFIANFKVTPMHTYTAETGSLEAASRNSLLAETRKAPSRDSIHTSLRKHPTLRRELGMALRA